MSSNLSPQLRFDPEGISFSDPTLNIGIRHFGLRLTAAGIDATAAYGAASTAPDGAVSAEAEPVAGLTLRTTVQPLDGGDAVVVTHRIENPTDRPFFVKRVATGQVAATAAVLHGKGGWLGMDLRYAHTDNVRTERYPHCQMEYPYERMLPTGTVRLGGGEDQAFPALYLRDLRGGGGILFAAASQAFNDTAFEMRKRGLVQSGLFDRFAILHDAGQSDGFELPAGAGVTLDGIYIQILRDTGPADAMTDYIDFLASRFTFRGPATPLLKEAFHCTWNYGVFADQTEASLLPTARFIAANLPGIKWFLMDAGYLHGDIGTTFLDRFYPDPNQYVSAGKWPRGIRGFADELRRLGLRPGIWWSPSVTVPSRLHDEHPDWFLRNVDGSLYLIGGKNAFLDYTHPGAVDYLDRTLAVILGEWGMDACKMDFWSQNFEDRHARLYDPRLTAVQARTRFFETVRRHLPPDGVFMTCVAVGMGNPFIGQWADTYRNTIDIGVGAWHEQVHNCFWALPTLCRAGRKTFLLNNDSVGIMPNHPDNENSFRLTWSFMHQGMIETGGRMETWPEPWVKAMRKLTDRCDRGYRVQCPDDRAFTGIPLPEALFVDYPDDSPTRRAGIRQSVALFNWSDEPRIVSVLRSRLGQTGPVRAENFWTGEREVFDGEFVSRRLAARSARLWDIEA